MLVFGIFVSVFYIARVKDLGTSEIGAFQHKGEFTAPVRMLRENHARLTV